MRRLVWEPKRAHPRLRDASAALPGVADRKPHAAVSQPPAVTLVVFLETPGGVKMADQRQLGSLTSACAYRLVEGKRPWYVGDGACGNKHLDLVCHISPAAVETDTGQVFFPLRNFLITPHQQMLLSSVSLPSVPLSGLKVGFVTTELTFSETLQKNCEINNIFSSHITERCCSVGKPKKMMVVC